MLFSFPVFISMPSKITLDLGCLFYWFFFIGGCAAKLMPGISMTSSKVSGLLLAVEN